MICAIESLNFGGENRSRTEGQLQKRHDCQEKVCCCWEQIVYKYMLVLSIILLFFSLIIVYVICICFLLFYYHYVPYCYIYIRLYISVINKSSCLCLLTLLTELRRIKEEESPLIIRIMLGPYEDVSKIFIMDTQKTHEVSHEVCAHLRTYIYTFAMFLHKG